MPELSIIVSAKNEAASIDACLSSLLAQKTSEAFEVIVVDNNSDDQTCQIVADWQQNHPNLKLLHQSKPGSAAARNLGALHAAGSILLFTDADCEPEQNWAHTAAARFQVDESVGFVGGQNLTRWRPAMSEWEKHADQLFYDLESDRSEKFPGFLPWAPTCNLAVRKDVFTRLGGFEEHWQSAAYDVDLCWRIVLAGYLAEFEPRAVVYHQRRGDFESLRRQMYNYGFYNELMSETYRRSLSMSRLRRWKNRVTSYLARRQQMQTLPNFSVLQKLRHEKTRGSLRAWRVRKKSSERLLRNPVDLCESTDNHSHPELTGLLKEGWCYWPYDAAGERSMVLYHVYENRSFELDELGWLVFRALRAEKTDAELVELLQREYDAEPATLLDDVQALKSRFREESLLC